MTDEDIITMQLSPSISQENLGQMLLRLNNLQHVKRVDLSADGRTLTVWKQNYASSGEKLQVYDRVMRVVGQYTTTPGRR